jgi:hypothetical protein
MQLKTMLKIRKIRKKKYKQTKTFNFELFLNSNGNRVKISRCFIVGETPNFDPSNRKYEYTYIFE